jgi:Spy/CpxP family protein refolding chaperone
MKRTQWLLMAALAGAALFVGLLALRTNKPPFLPADAEHDGFVSGRACLTCHGPDGAAPQSKGHPLGNDCLRCHAAR